MSLPLQQELFNFRYREQSIRLRDLFPRLDTREVRAAYSPLFQEANPHKIILAVATKLAQDGYKELLQAYGFHNAAYATFTGHAHQCTPALGVVLKVLGFPNVSYLEGFRIREQYTRMGRIEKVPPVEEPEDVKRAEFVAIKRIPYCSLEVFIDGEPFHLSPKHLQSTDGGLKPLLTPICYRSDVSDFGHPDDKSKSGIYLQPVIPERRNRGTDDPLERVVWMKQTPKDPAPELFATFLRMPLR